MLYTGLGLMMMCACASLLCRIRERKLEEEYEDVNEEETGREGEMIDTVSSKREFRKKIKEFQKTNTEMAVSLLNIRFENLHSYIPLL